MTILDSRDQIAAVDQSNVLGSVEKLPDQCLHAWQQGKSLQVPDEYKSVTNVVMAGMGGSGLGARVIESVYADQLKIPLVRVNGYSLPGFVDQNSLVFCSSYSGTTEETISNAKQAIERKAKWMAIGTGATLLDLAKSEGVPYFVIDPKENPSNQPRMAIGYSVIGQLALSHQAGIIQVLDQEIQEIAQTMKMIIEQSKVEVSEEQNSAKQLAKKMHGKITIYVSSEHLIGAMHTVNNQLNENAKAISIDVTIPELNHHLMEGLKHPVTNGQNLLFAFAQSNLYTDRIRKRIALTQEVVRKQGIESVEITLISASKLSQAFELIQLGAYTNLYVSMLYNQNPAPIPWVDWFKEQLGKVGVN